MKHLIESLELKEGKQLRGYKVMRSEGGKAIAGADSRQGFPLKKGHVIKMPGKGVYLSLGRQYVLDYYSGLADNEVLLTLSFDSGDITFGNITDRETEIAVKKAKVVKIEKVSA